MRNVPVCRDVVIGFSNAAAKTLFAGGKMAGTGGFRGISGNFARCARVMGERGLSRLND